MTRLALVGAGSWGAKLLITIVRSELLDLAAVVTTRGGEYVRGVVPFAGPVLGDYRELAALAGEIDGVVLATPPAGRAEQIEFFLDQAIPVFAEKPMTLNADATQRLVARARKAETPLVEDFVQLYSWPYRETLRHVVDGYREIESCGGNDGPVRDYSPLYDYGPHDVSMSLRAFGERPASISASVFNVRAPDRFSVRAELDFGSAGRAVIAFGNTFESRRRSFRLIDAENEWLYDDLDESKLRKNGQPQPCREQEESPLTAALHSFTGHRIVLTADESAWLSTNVADVLHELDVITGPLIGAQPA